MSITVKLALKFIAVILSCQVVYLNLDDQNFFLLRSPFLFSWDLRDNCYIYLISIVYRTALHYAAGHVQYFCVKSLVATGCSVNQVDTRGCTPLHYAAAADEEAK